MAGTDCGFGTIAGMDVGVPSVTWAKFRSQSEGAKMASAYLWAQPPELPGVPGLPAAAVLPD
jgi:hypothetical protein